VEPSTGALSLSAMQLYVSVDRRHPNRHDMGSVLCLRVLQHLPEGHVSVHDARSAVPRPTWLTGTPTLVIDGGTVLRGHEALDHLQHVSVEMARAATAHPTRPRPTRAMMAPAPVGLVAEKRARPQQVGEEEGDAVVDDEVSALFASRLDASDDLGDEEGERKITGDDLARALRERDAVAPPPPTANAPPPPPPQMSD
jgi:hypothetical protein